MAARVAGEVWPDAARWAALGCSFASLIGELKFWVRNLLTVSDLKHQMSLLFGSRLLETVLVIEVIFPSTTQTKGRGWSSSKSTNLRLLDEDFK